MAINITPSFIEGLEAELTTLAFCWRIIRRDGVAFGFTSHDRDLLIAGLRYRASPGIDPSAIQWSGGLETDTMDITGALSSDALTDEDMMAGRYDGARVLLFLIDWEHPQEDGLYLVDGELGRIGHNGTGFTAELKNAAHKLKQPAVELLSPECRAEFGDRRCRIDLAQYRKTRKITQLLSAERLKVDGAPLADHVLAYGKLRFVTGANSGCDIGIATNENGVIWLMEPPPFTCSLGDRVEWTQGCDKRFSTCCDSYANGANYQGEPYVPGNDLLMRYPGL